MESLEYLIDALLNAILNMFVTLLLLLNLTLLLHVTKRKEQKKWLSNFYVLNYTVTYMMLSQVAKLF